jgi:enolase
MRFSSPNQAGTLTETKAALDAASARDSGRSYQRSGETEDVTIAHLSIGWDAVS